MTTAERLLTADEFMELPSDPCGGKMELLDGRVVVAPPAGEQHSDTSAGIYDGMAPFVREHRMGKLRMEASFKVRTGPDRVVVPDVSFVELEKLDPARDVRRIPEAAPTLAVEVISPGDVDEDVAEKVAEYLAAGTARVWVVRPRLRTVTIHRDDGTIVLRQPGDTLTSDDAGFSVEGFSLPVEQIFAD